jgi:hypothetical protein
MDENDLNSYNGLNEICHFYPGFPIVSYVWIIKHRIQLRYPSEKRSGL